MFHSTRLSGTEGLVFALLLAPVPDLVAMLVGVKLGRRGLEGASASVIPWSLLAGAAADVVPERQIRLGEGVGATPTVGRRACLVLGRPVLLLRSARGRNQNHNRHPTLDHASRSSTSCARVTIRASVNPWVRATAVARRVGSERHPSVSVTSPPLDGDRREV